MSEVAALEQELKEEQQRMGEIFSVVRRAGRRGC